MRRIRIIMLAVLLACTLAACGGSGGTAIGHTQSCRSSTRQGRCEGRYKKLTGRLTYEIKDLNYVNGTPVDVEIELAVQSGGLRVELAGPGGQVSSGIATPSEPLSLTGVALVDAFGALPVVLQVVEGEAVEGVTYTIAWAVQ